MKDPNPKRQAPEKLQTQKNASGTVLVSLSSIRNGGEGRGEEVLTKTNGPSMRVAPLPARASQGEGAGHLGFKNRVEMRPTRNIKERRPSGIFGSWGLVLLWILALGSWKF